MGGSWDHGGTPARAFCCRSCKLRMPCFEKGRPALCISTTTQAKDQTSEASEGGAPLRASGAPYKGAPSNVLEMRGAPTHCHPEVDQLQAHRSEIHNDVLRLQISMLDRGSARVEMGDSSGQLLRECARLWKLPHLL